MAKTELAKVDTSPQALAKLTTIKDVTKVASVLEGMKDVLAGTGATRDEIDELTEKQCWIWRRGGEIIGKPPHGGRRDGQDEGSSSWFSKHNVGSPDKDWRTRVMMALAPHVWEEEAFVAELNKWRMPKTSKTNREARFTVGRLVAGGQDIQRKRRRKARADVARRELGEDSYHIVDGSFQDHAHEVDDDSVDLIFTDPPYDRKSVPLYGDLAEFAKAKLVDGGYLMCYASNYAIPDILDLMRPHLSYCWTCCIYHEQVAARRSTRFGRLIVKWKPLLWFAKGSKKDNTLFADVVHSPGREKGSHDWQQSLAPATYYIEKMTDAGAMVVDPFCGGGTTYIAAIRLKRKWLGFEVDSDSAAIARKRLKDEFQRTS